MAFFKPNLGDVQALISVMDAALLPCLPARELHAAADRSSSSSLHVDVERHAREFMDAAKNLQLVFIRVGHQYQPTKDTMLRKEIMDLEAELKAKDELMERQLQLVTKWKQLLLSHQASSVRELVKV